MKVFNELFGLLNENDRKINLQVDNINWYLTKNHLKGQEFDVEQDGTLWKVFANGHLIYTYDSESDVVDVKTPKGKSIDFPLMDYDKTGKKIKQHWKKVLEESERIHEGAKQDLVEILNAITPDLDMKIYMPEKGNNFIRPAEDTYKKARFFEFKSGGPNGDLAFEVVIKLLDNDTAEIEAYSYNTKKYASLAVGSIKSADAFVKKNVDHKNLKKLL